MITFNDKQQAEEYIENITGNKTGKIMYKNGKYIVEIIDNSDVTCPFCGETGFDKIGLKSHLEHGDCNLYNNIEGLNRLM